MARKRIKRIKTEKKGNDIEGQRGAEPTRNLEKSKVNLKTTRRFSQNTRMKGR